MIDLEITKTIKKLSEALKKLDKNLNRGLTLLAQYGWYINQNIKLTESAELIAHSQKNKTKEIDDFFIKYYSEHFENLIKKLKIKFPERTGILDEGMKTHNQELFFASTQLFLSQADGICQGNLYKAGEKRDKKPLKQFLEKTNSLNFITSTLSPIIELSAIDVHVTRKSEFISELNRHAVIHGEDTEYGTRINSLKAFSLLCFVADFIDRYKNNENKL